MMRNPLLTRRGLLAAAAGTLAASGLPALADINEAQYFVGMVDDNGKAYRKTNFKKIDRKWRRQLVKYPSTEPPGTIVVDTDNHYLYVIFENNTALRYGVGV